MRFLAGGILTLLALWSGYWLVGERLIESRIATFLASGVPKSVVLDQTGFDISGFPNRFDLTVNGPNFRDPATGWGWSAEFAQVFAMTWKPWHLIAALPTEQRLQTPFGALRLASSRFMASLQVVPSTDLALDEAVLEVENAALSGALFREVQADKLVVALKHDAAAPFAYRFGVQASVLAALVAGAAPMEAARLDAVLVMTAALDRTAAVRLPGLAEIEINAVSLTRGAVKVNGAGHIARSAEGFAEGLVQFKVEGWRDLPVMLADFGLIKPEIAPTLAKELDIIAAEQGDPAVLSLPLSFKSGLGYLGALPISRVPKLVQRQ